jgi:glycosyltransferase involved in cell wall biosynthesis
VKICVVTPLYTIAGVPLAQLRFARALAGKGFEVDFVIGRVDPETPLPELRGITVYRLNRPNVRAMFLPLCHYLRATRPDIVFSAEDHLNAVVLLAALMSGCKAKISGSSRVTPFDTYSDVAWTKPWLLKYVMRAVMWRADALTCVSRDMVEQYRHIFRSSPHVNVYNIVHDNGSQQRMQEQLDHQWFRRRECPVLVAAGRLAPWKGFADLVLAMQLVNQRRPVNLIILGDGPLRAGLETLVRQHGLEDRISLPGYVENPLKFFAAADGFVLSSHVEGLPNVLVEAMMCGCTPVATDCPTGPREVLQDGKYGYLVPVSDPAAMANAIELALDNPVPAKLLAEAVRPFEENAVLQRHFEVLNMQAAW